MRKIIFLLALSFLFAQSAYSQVQKTKMAGPVCNSRATYLPKPEFSDKTKNNIPSGSVYVRVLIDKEGNVKWAKAKTGSTLLYAEVEKAALEAKFKVTRLSGVAVEVSCGIVYNFNFSENIPAENERTKQSFSPSIEITKCYKCDDIILSVPTPKYPKYVGFGSHIYNGEVAVQLLIDERGNIKSVKGISGHPYFRLILEKESLKAKFKPRIILGKPIETSVVIVYKITSTRPIVISHFPPNTKPIFEPKLKYPEAARMVNIAGEVVVEILVDENGNVEEAKVLSGHPLLIEESLKAANLTRFKPYKLGGVPVKVRWTLVYDFTP